MTKIGFKGQTEYYLNPCETLRTITVLLKLPNAGARKMEQMRQVMDDHRNERLITGFMGVVLILSCLQVITLSYTQRVTTNKLLKKWVKTFK